ncbi:MAG TPA: hypothetical protein VGL63_15160 [Streptosporangiaceae bacterium]|jgi:protein-L-isoaspartate O-methyltransferase
MQPVTFPELPPVDRRPFIPDDVWVVANMGGRSCRVTMTRWGGSVWWPVDDSITTSLKDGVWTVSSSSPAAASMIGALRLEPGMRVLEIGTETGWNAACLAALGAEVVSVEIDAVIAAQARANLHAAGYGRVTLIGDGERGAAGYAPYDRVLAT